MKTQQTSIKQDAQLLKQLMPFVWPHRWILCWSFFLLPLVTLSLMAQPYVVRWAIDGPIAVGNISGVYQSALIFLIVIIFHYSVRYFQMVFAQEAGQRIIKDIRTALYSHLQSLPLDYFHKNPVGKLVTRVTSDVESLSEMFSSGGLAILQDLALIAGGVIGMVLMHWKLALIALVMMGLNLFLMEFFRRKSRHAYDEIRIKLAKLNTFIQEHMTGMELVQLFQQEKSSMERFSEESWSYFKVRMDSIVYSLSFNSLVELLTVFTQVIILWYSAAVIAEGEMTYGLLAAFFLLIGMVFAD